MFRFADVQDGTNCRACGMTARSCTANEPGEVAQCCTGCDHPGGPHQAYTPEQEAAYNRAVYGPGF